MLGTTTEKVKAVKQLLVNQIFHHHHGHSNKGQQHQRQNSNNHGGGIPFLRKRSSSSSGGRPLSGPAGVANRGGGGGGPGSALSASSHNIDSAGRGREFEGEERQMRRSQHRRQTSAPYNSNTLGSPERAAALRARQQQLQQQQQQFSQEDQMVEGRFIGHPSSSAGAASEFAYPVVGRRGRPIQSNLPGKFEFVKQYMWEISQRRIFFPQAATCCTTPGTTGGCPAATRPTPPSPPSPTRAPP